jgi:hypothetical protein
MVDVAHDRETRQLGLGIPSTQRRHLSDEAYHLAVNYGLSVLNKRDPQSFVSSRAGDADDTDEDAMYVGNEAVVVFVEDGGAFFDVVVRAGA